MSPVTLARRLNLNGDPAALRGALGGKWRNRLVRAEASRLTVRISQLPPDPDHWLLRREAAQAKARRYRRLPGSFAVAWVLQTPNAAPIFVASLDGAPVAAMLFLHHGAMASYHIGWSGPKWRRLNAHNLLMWRAMEWFAARDVLAIELDTLNTEMAPGLARFKLGTGAKPLMLAPCRVSAPGTRLVARPGPAGPDRHGARRQHPATGASRMTLRYGVTVTVSIRSGSPNTVPFGPSPRLMASITSIPSVTCPITVYCPSRNGPG